MKNRIVIIMALVVVLITLARGILQPGRSHHRAGGEVEATEFMGKKLTADQPAEEQCAKGHSNNRQRDLTD
jgi:hypothetical protein